MIEMMKKAWKTTTEYTKKNWLGLSLASIFAVSFATLNVVFPALIFPTLVTLATLAVGAATYFVGKAIVNFFRAETAPAEVTASKNSKGDTKGSTATMTKTLEANKAPTAEADKAAEAAKTAKANLKADVAKTAAPANDENENQAAASFSM